jgi:hypothetical protein
LRLQSQGGGRERQGKYQGAVRRIDRRSGAGRIVTAAVFVLVEGLAVIGLILGGRWLDYRAWQRSLVAFRLQWPRGLSVDELAAWLDVVTARHTARSRVLLSWPSFVLEVVATEDGVAFYLLVAETAKAELLAAMRSTLAGVRLEEARDYLRTAPVVQVASELRLTDARRVLAHGRAGSAVAAFLAALQPLGHGEVVRTQWIVGKLATPGPSPQGTDRETASAERLKHGEPLLRLTGRIGATAGSAQRARALGRQVAGTFRVLDAPGISVVRRAIPSAWVARRLVARAVPVAVWPVVVNVREAVGLLGLPIGELHLPGLSLGSSRQLPPATAMPTRGVVVAQSNYPGMTGRSLALAAEDRLRHLHVLGPTGVGKSTLLANMVIQDVAAGFGVVAFDPKGDFISDVLDRVPDERADDVIVLDASSTDRPLGFNPLAVIGHSEHDRELAVDRIVHVLREIYHSSWGVRTDEVVRAVLLTLVNTRAVDGTNFTLCEVPELLMNPDLQAHVMRQPSLPRALRDYWVWYETLSEGERLQIIGPSLNKLRSFSMRSSLRLLFGQDKGIDLTDIFTKRRVLLVSLAKGKLGTETANLLGSLLVASLWQATLGRAAVPPSQRRPVWCYLDEFQDLLRVSSELGDMLAQARGLGLGLVMANQYLDQLPKAVKSAVLGTARSQIVFQLGLDDARELGKHFEPALSADDLRGLRAYEVTMWPCVGGQTLAPVTGVTAPLGEPVRDGVLLAVASRARYGVRREAVEAALLARVNGDEPEEIGRRRAGGPI